MSTHHLSSVFFGGVEVDANRLRKSLRIGSYTLWYDFETLCMTLNGRGEVIWRITCAHESAVKFAKDFGFPEDPDPKCARWTIFVPELVLLSDGSEDAKRLLDEMHASGLPFVVVKDQSKPGVTMRDGRHIIGDGWTTEMLVAMIREDAAKYADVIALFNER